MRRIAAEFVSLSWLGTLTQIRQQPGQLRSSRAEELIQLVLRTSGYERPQRLGERCEGQPGSTQFDARADERDETPLAGSAYDLLDEPGLADAGLAGDEDKTRTATDRIRDDRGRLIEFGPAADEDGTRDPADHRAIMRGIVSATNLTALRSLCVLGSTTAA